MRNRSSICPARSRVSGSTLLLTSRTASAVTPPAPTTMTGPRTGSVVTPMSNSIPPETCSATSSPAAPSPSIRSPAARNCCSSVMPVTTIPLSLL